MAVVIVDLTSEGAEILAEARKVLRSKVLPGIVEDLHSAWPKRTGRSAAAWVQAGDTVLNPLDYAAGIRTRDGLATDTVLQPILNLAQDKTWTP